MDRIVDRIVDRILTGPTMWDPKFQSLSGQKLSSHKTLGR